MKIIIADDERMVRVSLKSMLSESKFNNTVVAEAINGTELIKLVKEHKPDVVFVDIKMPKVDGLTAIKECKDFSPSTYWIILTGFPQFEYAQQAVKLGAFNYMLKPPNPKELDNNLSELSKEIQKQKSSSNKEFERNIITSYNLYTYLHNINLQDFNYNNIEGTLFIVDSSLNENQKSKKLCDFHSKLRSISKPFISDKLNIAVFYINTGDLTTVYNYNKKNSSIVCNVKKFENSLKKLIDTMTSQTFHISYIKINNKANILDFYNEIDNIQKYIPLRIILSSNTELTDTYLIKVCTNNDDKLMLCTMVDNMCKYYNQKLVLKYKQSLNTLNNFLCKNKSILNNENTRIMIINFIKYSINIKLSNIQNTNECIDNWINKFKKACNLILDIKSQNSSTGIIQQMTNYINANYMKDISISLIADELNVTPNYLSSLFHSKSGIRFTSYLAQVRISKAKQLMAKNPDASIKNISNEVGYYSTSYFIKLFRKIENCYPSEYQKNISKAQA